MHEQNKKTHIETKIQPWVDHDETFVRFNVLFFLCYKVIYLDEEYPPRGGIL